MKNSVKQERLADEKIAGNGQAPLRILFFRSNHSFISSLWMWFTDSHCPPLNVVQFVYTWSRKHLVCSVLGPGKRSRNLSNSRHSLLPVK